MGKMLQGLVSGWLVSFCFLTIFVYKLYGYHFPHQPPHVDIAIAISCEKCGIQFYSSQEMHNSWHTSVWDTLFDRQSGPNPYRASQASQVLILIINNWCWKNSKL